jgi:hypothetical protein
MQEDTRLWRYRPGEARLFNHPDEVPEGEGWGPYPVPAVQVDMPQALLSPPGPDQELTDQEKAEREERARLLQCALDLGLKADETWTSEQLRKGIAAAADADMIR